LKEEKLFILKTMHEATNRMDLTSFAQTVNLNPNQAIEKIQELTKEGFLQKSSKGYSLSDKGVNASKINQAVPTDKAFNFYIGVDRPLGISAQSIEEFYRQIKQVCSDALDFHLFRGDFENWIRDVLLDDELAAEVGNFKNAEMHVGELRKALLNAIDAKYGVAELL
jgi:predicted transcriptional regulator